MNKSATRQALIAAAICAAVLPSCTGSNSPPAPPDELMASLAGDWIFYQTDGSKVSRTAKHEYFHFDGSGTNFTMRRACASGANPATAVISQSTVTLQTATGETLSAVFDNGKLKFNLEDGTPIYLAHPVATLRCEIANGKMRVATQAMSPRMLPVTSPVPSTSVTAGSVDDNLVAHLQQVAGIMLPTGTDDAHPVPNGPPVTTNYPGKDSKGAYTTVCTDTPTIFQKNWPTLKLLADSAPAIYPGALIQGGAYEKHLDFVLITTSAQDPNALKRAPITVNIAGPVIKNAKGESTTSVMVSDPSASSNVNAAIASAVQQGTITGTAQFTVDQTTASSEEQIKVAMGIAGSVSDVPVSASADFSYTNSDSHNYVMFVLNQKFFSASVDNFNSAVDPFASTANDPPDRVTGKPMIRPDNPPLYVSNVDYGRLVMIQAISSNAASDVSAAVSAAASADVGKLSASEKAAFESSLENTSLKILIKGGKDTSYASWKFLPAGSGAELFQSLSSLLVGIEQFDNQTPFVPLSFSLNYLVDNGANGNPNSGLPAAMLYSTSYSDHQCHIVRPDTPVVTTFSVIDPDDRLEVSYCGKKITYDYKPGGNTINSQPPDAKSTCLTDFNSHQMEFSLTNKGTGSTNVEVHVYQGGKKKLYRYIGGTAGNGAVWDMKIEVNAHGTLSINSENDYYANSPLMSYETSEPSNDPPPQCNANGNPC